MICGYEFPLCGQAHGHDGAHIPWGDGRRMKQFLLFAGDRYYPSGGMDDFVSDHETLEAALVAAKPHTDDKYKWWHIWDSVKREIVERTW